MIFPHPALASAEAAPERVPALGDVDMSIWEPAPAGTSPVSGPVLLDPASGGYVTVSPFQQTAMIASSAGSQIAQAAAAGQNVGQAAAITGVATAGQIAAGMTAAAWAVPVIGAAVAGVTFWLASIFRRNAQKEQATRIVNEIEPKLKENLAAYFSGPRTRASQLQALANFDAAWNAMVQACRNSQLGSAGERCITDRQQGACTWKASCTQRVDGICVDYALDPNGECWNWFVGYRDPIARDPAPSRGGASAAQEAQAPESAGGGFAGDGLLLLAGTGLIVAAALMPGGGK